MLRHATPLFIRGFPQVPRTRCFTALHPRLLFALVLRGCKAAPRVLGSISRHLRQAAGSPAQQGSSRRQFQKLFIPRSHGCLRRDASPLPLRDEMPKGYAFAKIYGEKMLVTQTPPPQPHGCLCACLGVCLITLEMARTEAVLAPAACCRLLLAVTVTQGNSLSGLGAISKTF